MSALMRSLTDHQKLCWKNRLWIIIRSGWHIVIITCIKTVIYFPAKNCKMHPSAAMDSWNYTISVHVTTILCQDVGLTLIRHCKRLILIFFAGISQWYILIKTENSSLPFSTQSKTFFMVCLHGIGPVKIGIPLSWHSKSTWAGSKVISDKFFLDLHGNYRKRYSGIWAVKRKIYSKV